MCVSTAPHAEPAASLPSMLFLGTPCDQGRVAPWPSGSPALPAAHPALLSHQSSGLWVGTCLGHEEGNTLQLVGPPATEGELTTKGLIPRSTPRNLFFSLHTSWLHFLILKKRSSVLGWAPPEADMETRIWVKIILGSTRRGEREKERALPGMGPLWGTGAQSHWKTQGDSVEHASELLPPSQ